MESLADRLKADCDSLLELPRELYFDLLPYLNIKDVDRNTVLKQKGEVEIKSRYIVEGLLAIFEDLPSGPVCRRIYGPTDIACDFKSYHTESLTDIIIITAYSDCKIAELTKESESAVIGKISQFAKLGIKINHRITSRDADWKRMLWMKPEDRYVRLRQICPEFGQVKVKDIAGILNLPERTVFRLRLNR